MARKAATHNGIFHSDEVFAIAALRMIEPELEVVRSRDKDVLAEADMRIDVGGQYNHATGDYDHHQKGGAGTRENGIPYASIGLIWKHYGAEICGSDEVARCVDEDIIHKIDAVDTGHANCKYEGVAPVALNQAIYLLNPDWQDKNPDHDEKFELAVDFAGHILAGAIKNAQGKAISRDCVLQAAVPGQDYIVLDQYCDWQEAAVQETDAKYIVFPGMGGNWMVNAIPTTVGGRENRKPLPAEWAGLRDDELYQATGVKDAVFCHPGRFIGGAQSKEGAIALAEIASAYQN